MTETGTARAERVLLPRLRLRAVDGDDVQGGVGHLTLVHHRCRWHRIERGEVDNLCGDDPREVLDLRVTLHVQQWECRGLRCHINEVEPPTYAKRQAKSLLVLDTSDQHNILERHEVDRGLRPGAAVVWPGKVRVGGTVAPLRTGATVIEADTIALAMYVQVQAASHKSTCTHLWVVAAGLAAHDYRRKLAVKLERRLFEPQPKAVDYDKRSIVGAQPNVGSGGLLVDIAPICCQAAVRHMDVSTVRDLEGRSLPCSDVEVVEYHAVDRGIHINDWRHFIQDGAAGQREVALK